MSNATLNLETRKKLSELALRRRGAIYVSNDKNDKKLSVEDLAKFLGHLTDLGYYADVLNDNIKKELQSMSMEDINAFLYAAKQQNNFTAETSPLYKNFPEGVENTPYVNLILDAIYYAISGFEDVLFEEDEQYKRTMEEYESSKSLRKLSLTDSYVFSIILNNLLAMTTAPSRTDKEDILFLINYLSDQNKLQSINLADIPFKEIKVMVLAELSKNDVLLQHLNNSNKKLTTTDVLRFLEYLTNGECDLLGKFPLPNKDKLKEMTHLIIGLLECSNASDGHYDDIKRYKEEWKYILRNIEKDKKTNLVIDIEDHLYKNKGKKIETWAGKEEKMYLEIKEFSDKGLPIPNRLFYRYLGLFKDRPGEFVRRADKLLMLNGLGEYSQEFISFLYECIVKGETRIGIQFYNYLLRRDEVRLVHFGTSSKLLELKDDYKETSLESVITLVKQAVLDNIKNKVAEKNKSNSSTLRILYNEELFSNVAISTSNRNAGKNFLGMTTGSRIDLSGHDYLRVFTKWEGHKGYDTDIDLAVVAISGINKDMQSVKEDLENDSNAIKTLTCAYYELRNEFMTHSGDVRRNNGEEYIDIDVAALRKSYDGILVRNTNYNGSDMPTIKTGVMSVKKENAQKGNIFKENEVLFSSECQGNYSSSLAFYLDLKNMVLYWIDTPCQEGMFSSFDSSVYNKLKNLAVVKQSTADRLMLNDVIVELSKNDIVYLINEETYCTLSETEGENVVVLVDKRGEDYIVYSDILSNLIID